MTDLARHSSLSTTTPPTTTTTSRDTEGPTFASDRQRRDFYGRGLEREHDFEALEVEGELPADLVGTLYRNGPGLVELHGRRYSHPFEGDGAISALRLRGDGTAFGALRVIESAGLVEERARGRALYGSLAPWPRRVLNNLRGRVKNTANTSLMVYQQRLFALMEAAVPTEIDPATLATIGECSFGNVVRGPFSAHPHRVAARGTRFNFGIRYGRHSAINIYELPDDGAPRHLTRVPVGFPPMLHDFIATETTLIFFLSPVSVRVLPLLSGLAGFEDLFAWQPERGTEIITVPIDDPGAVKRFTVDAFYQWHFANAFDVDDGSIVVDYVRYPDFGSFKGLASGRDFAPGILHRARLAPGTESLTSEALEGGGCEFPQVNPRAAGARHGSIWVMTKDDRGIARVDTASGAIDAATLEVGHLASEPVFVPSRDAGAGEADGYALVLCFDVAASRSYVAVFDAANVAAGPRARVWFDHQLPQTFHGAWIAG